MSDIKRMTASEFREAGLLQELNRQFLHPRGLALEVVIADGAESFGGVWDYSSDPEGVTFHPTMPLAEKAALANTAAPVKAEERLAKFGWIVQPAAFDDRSK